MNTPSVAASLVGLSHAPINVAINPTSDPYVQSLVSKQVHEAMIQAGLGARDQSAPLADIIRPGDHVLLKPNWVFHYNRRRGGSMAELITHPSVVLAALEQVLLAQPGRVTIGDAPIQGCEFDQVCTPALRQCAAELANTKGVAIEFVDFRRTLIHDGDLVRDVRTGVRSLDQYAMFDLGTDSLLEPISKRGVFRVTMYNPDQLAREHRPGRHRYLIARQALEANFVLSLPKLKTHRKAGITAALKNLIGINGDKDFLPHHRVGGSALGGDCYPGVAPLKRIAEALVDASNRRIGKPSQRIWNSVAYNLLRLHPGDCDLEGGWSGNDTIWRTTLDLNRIMLYGRPDGTMADVAQRRLWSLTDCIIAGQAEGPLAPEPLPLGVMTFSGDAVAAEAVHCALLHIDYRKVPLTFHAFGAFRWPLTHSAHRLDAVVGRFEGHDLSLAEIAARLGLDARLASGWVGAIEDARARTSTAA